MLAATTKSKMVFIFLNKVENKVPKKKSINNSNTIEENESNSQEITPRGNRREYFEFNEVCTINPEGVHMYKNNICNCGKVIDIIQEDDEEYDDDENFCLISKTGNHHYVNGLCSYCSCQNSEKANFGFQIKRMNTMKKMSGAEVYDLVTLGNERIRHIRGGSDDYLKIKTGFANSTSSSSKNMPLVIVEKDENIDSARTIGDLHTEPNYQSARVQTNNDNHNNSYTNTVLNDDPLMTSKRNTLVLNEANTFNEYEEKQT